MGRNYSAGGLNNFSNMGQRKYKRSEVDVFPPQGSCFPFCCDVYYSEMVRKGCKSTLYGILICTAISIVFSWSMPILMTHSCLSCMPLFLSGELNSQIYNTFPTLTVDELMFPCLHYCQMDINLRVPFHEVFGAVKCNLKEAVQLGGLVWQSRAHYGLPISCIISTTLQFFVFNENML